MTSQSKVRSWGVQLGILDPHMSGHPKLKVGGQTCVGRVGLLGTAPRLPSGAQEGSAPTVILSLAQLTHGKTRVSLSLGLHFLVHQK